MKGVYHRDFLLLNDTARDLYHNAASLLPVIDPHNHIDASALATNKRYENIYQLWVQSDPYKHRAMRMFGVAENLITGNAPDYDKFMAWATCAPYTIGNPLFHWSCMELQILFGIDDVLNTDNAKEIWERTNAKLAGAGFGAADIVKKLNVETLCTSDDLLDGLEHHRAMKEMHSGPTCLPSLRGDSILQFSPPHFGIWLDRLNQLTSLSVTNLREYKTAITNRLNFFDEAGCLLSDHSLDSGFQYNHCDEAKAQSIFQQLLVSDSISEEDIVLLQSHLLHFLGTEYSKRGWKLQLHIGAYRYTSSVLREKAGPAGGYACIGNAVDVKALCALLDGLDKKHCLPGTILYTLNPADNAVFASLCGSYAEDGVQGKIQFGQAWWYNDHEQGIRQQLLALSSYGLLYTSVGMTTDSRSILSFVRHEYFRRILCNWIGSMLEEGKLPNDIIFLSTLVQNISYHNIKNWMAQ